MSVDIGRLAKWYRWLVLAVGLQILIALSGGLIAVLPEGPAFVFALLRLLALLASSLLLAALAYLTSSAMGSRVPLLWAIAMFVPLVNLISLLVLSSKSTKICREMGVEVGLLGPKNWQDASTVKLHETFD